jgi:molybdopterin synthase catalytic subunit
LIEITEDDFRPEEIIERAKCSAAGAVVTFLGTVRDDGIREMVVEAYPEAALAELERIRDEAASRFGLTSVYIVHRTGRLAVGDNIVLIVVSAAHRQEAFGGCSYILEELKSRVPIWKKEISDEGQRWI